MRRSKAKDAGGLTPVKDDNETAPHFTRRTLRFFNCVDYIMKSSYRDMKADYERQAADLTDLLARLNAERSELSNGVGQEHPALVAFAKYQNIEKLTREILIELVDHIKVYENGNISV